MLGDCWFPRRLRALKSLKYPDDVEKAAAAAAAAATAAGARDDGFCRSLIFQRVFAGHTR